jgi:hypothetical protein
MSVRRSAQNIVLHNWFENLESRFQKISDRQIPSVLLLYRTDIDLCSIM